MFAPYHATIEVEDLEGGAHAFDVVYRVDWHPNGHRDEQPEIEIDAITVACGVVLDVETFAYALGDLFALDVIDKLCVRLIEHAADDEQHAAYMRTHGEIDA